VKFYRKYTALRGVNKSKKIAYEIERLKDFFGDFEKTLESYGINEI